MNATIAMIAATKLGIGLKFHYELMRSKSFDTTSTSKIANSFGIEKKVWATQILSEENHRLAREAAEDARRLGLPGTPSYVVLTPKENAYLFANLDEAIRFVDEGYSAQHWPWVP